MASSSSVIKKSSKKPGKTVAIFAGVHGNELAGVLAVRQAIDRIELSCGTAYFVIANPPAVSKKTRMIAKNLNRCFFAENDGQTWEDRRARQLMKILDGCEALLDLHGYNGSEDSPFVICDKYGVKLASELEFASVLTGISEVATGGTDCYMSSKGKIGLCLECGSNFYPEKYAPLALDSIYRFLTHFGLIKAISKEKRETPQEVYKVEQVVKRMTDDFSFNREYKNFELLTPGKQFARDGETSFVAEENRYIIFPREKQKIGEESFILISKIA